MNEEDVSKVLGQVVPEAPSPDAWAGAAVRRSRRRRRAGVAAIAALAVIAVPVGAMVFSKPPSTAVPAAPGGEVTGDVLIFGTAEEPELCLGAVRESYPPQCGGPSLKGNFDWAQVAFDDEGGLRWTDQRYTVRGFYDPDDGDSGSFTLTAPVVLAPEGEPDELDFPQLCDDPYADGGSPDAGVTPGEDPALAEEAAMQKLSEVTATLPLVAAWLSDSDGLSGNYNVLVQGDADAAFQKLRAVWPGGLCVQSSDAPTEKRRVEALDAVVAALPQGQFLTGDAGGVKPELTVQVVIATPEIEAAVRKAAEEVPVTLTAVFTPVAPDTPSTSPAPSDPTSSPSTSTSRPGTPSSSPSTLPDPDTSADPGSRLRILTGTAILWQRDYGLPRLCFTVGYSDPIQCDGPALKGDFSWDGIAYTEKNGVRTSEQYYTVTGEYDPSNGDWGAFVRHDAPIPGGMPGVELDKYSTLCADSPRSAWPPLLIADGGEGPSFAVMVERVCERLTGPVDEEKRDALVVSLRDAVESVGGIVLGTGRDGNDVRITVVAADAEVTARVSEVVEATGMPVVLRTKLTPPGEQDTTIVVPSH